MWWKIYFWIFAILSFVSFLMILPDISTFNLADWEGISELVILSLGAYAFVYKKNFFTSNFWKTVFYIYVPLWIVQLITYANAIPALSSYLKIFKYSKPYSYPEVVVSLIVGIPALYAIYKLGNHKNKKS